MSQTEADVTGCISAATVAADLDGNSTCDL